MTTRKRQNFPSRVYSDGETPTASDSRYGNETPITEKQRTASVKSETEASATVSPELDARITNGPRLWVLPTVAPAAFWAVAESPDRTQLAESLYENPPIIYAAELEPRERSQAVDCGRRVVNHHFRDRIHEAAFSLIKRLIISFIWVGVATVSLRIPSEFKVIDAFVLLAGFGYLGYSVIRYGSAVARWHNRRVDTASTFVNAEFVRSPLVERLTNVLKFRAKLRPDERGKSPDDELLDISAYRRLIKDGVTTVEELGALGRAISSALKLTSSDEQDRKISDIAAEAGLNVETAIFYRDLAFAAKEIELIPDELVLVASG
ncbi:MAG: hypothetical protein V1899_01525 [Planctomycetota bacterium]